MTRPTFTPRRGSDAMRVLQHMQRTGRPMSRAQIRAELGITITNQINHAVQRGLLTVAGHPAVFYPTPELARAPLDGRVIVFWTPERDDVLRRHYATSTSTPALARRIGTTKESLRARAAELGLKKTAATKRDIMRKRQLGGRPYVTISATTNRILQFMQQGEANGATGPRIAELVGLPSASLVNNYLRAAIRRGIVVQRPINQRHYTYHLAAGHHQDDGRPTQIILPAADAPHPITTAPRSVFELGRAITRPHATTP